LRREVGARLGMVNSLEALAELACEEAASRAVGEGTRPGGPLPVVRTDAAAGAGRHAARLFGTAEALREAFGAPPPPREHDDYRCAVVWVREALGQTTFAAEWAAGRTMTWEDAVSYASGESEVK
jgi:hypothetical protein